MVARDAYMKRYTHIQNNAICKNYVWHIIEKIKNQLYLDMKTNKTDEENSNYASIHSDKVSFIDYAVECCREVLSYYRVNKNDIDKATNDFRNKLISKI